MINYTMDSYIEHVIVSVSSSFEAMIDSTGDIDEG